MNIIKKWKQEEDYTYHQIAYRLGISIGQASKLANGILPIKPHIIKRMNHVKYMEGLISGNPVDKPLLKQELREYINGYDLKLRI